MFLVYRIFLLYYCVSSPPAPLPYWWLYCTGNHNAQFLFKKKKNARSHNYLLHGNNILSLSLMYERFILCICTNAPANIKNLIISIKFISLFLSTFVNIKLVIIKRIDVRFSSICLYLWRRKKNMLYVCVWVYGRCDNCLIRWECWWLNNYYKLVLIVS